MFRPKWDTYNTSFLRGPGDIKENVRESWKDLKMGRSTMKHCHPFTAWSFYKSTQQWKSVERGILWHSIMGRGGAWSVISFENYWILMFPRRKGLAFFSNVATGTLVGRTGVTGKGREKSEGNQVNRTLVHCTYARIYQIKRAWKYQRRFPGLWFLEAILMAAIYKQNCVSWSTIFKLQNSEELLIYFVRKTKQMSKPINVLVF